MTHKQAFIISILVAIVIIALACRQQTVRNLETEWWGWPIVARETRDPDASKIVNGVPAKLFTDPNTQIGFRSDGTVVWRKVEK